MCDMWGLVKYFVPFLGSEEIKLNNNKYTVVKELGRGGFSNVYLVEKNGSKKDLYALKRVALSSAKKEKERALKEVEIFQKHKGHKHFLQMYDYEVVHSAGIEELLVLLDYYPLGTLADLTQKMEAEGKNLAEDVILNIFLGVCVAVKQLHNSSPPLAHRDLKPHNVLLGPNNHPVLTDFGSVTNARFTKKELKKMKTFLQEEANETTTESYCPPELYSFGGVLDDITLDERVDIWSLGCLLYAAAFHLNPFDREVMRGGSYRMAINNGKITIPSDSPYSEAFHSLIRSMIIVDASERPFIDEVIENTSKLLNAEAPDSDSFDSD